MKELGNKAPLWLIPARPLRAIAGGFLCGAFKYAPWDWTQDNGDREARVNEHKSALRRHGEKFTDPTEPDIDEETGQHHLILLATNAIMLIWHLGIDYVKPKNKPKKKK